MFDEDDVATGEFPAVKLEFDNDGHPVIPRISDEWLWAMQAAIANMQKSSRFRVESEDWFRPVPDIVKETVQSAAGMVAAPTIASLYELTDGFEMSWSYEEDGAFVPGGRVHLYGFAEVFGSWLHKLWGEHPDDAGDGEQDFTWEIRAFDAAEADSPYQVVMPTPEMLPTYNLYWHASASKTYPLRVDFLEYLQLLTETRGLHGWQWLVCDVDTSQDPEALEQIRRCTVLMKRLFPDVDLSRYTTIDEDEESNSEEE